MDKITMASLFDVDLNTSLDSSEEDSSDYGTVPSDHGIQSFPDRCKDVAAIMQPAPKSIKNDTDLIKEAIKSPPQPKPLVKQEIFEEVEAKDAEEIEHDDEDDEIELSDEVDKEISAFAKSVNATTPPSTPPAMLQVENDKPVEIETASGPTSSENNPLGLSPEHLKVFDEIKNRYPQFNLYDGNRAFRDFYRYKLVFLKTAFERFSLLDIKQMHGELKTIKLDHFLGEDVISPDLIRIKIESSYLWRTRLSGLLISAFEQYYVWKRWLDMMKSKLWKDHSQKGAHNRDGLTLEHLFDVEFYVSDLEGFIESAKHCDAILKAAADSLSRQLTCMQLRDQHGLKTDPHHVSKFQDPRKEDFDSIEEGTVVSAPKPTGEVLHHHDFGGVPVDEIAELG